MTVDPHVVKLRLDMILSHIEELKEVSQNAEDSFLSNSILRRATERSLQLIAQAIIDICTHIVAHNHWGAPQTYSDTVREVSNRGMIEKGLSSRLVELVKLRNVIVHLYLEIDPKIVYRSAVLAVTDAKLFIESMNKLFE
ncbi:MAG: DUF86 domain-containing protein [Candidatus Thorarchaeota archaeon]|nr:DUF86 domain-containing protein [Candidatus Thorarchaeota archaeon]